MVGPIDGTREPLTSHGTAGLDTFQIFLDFQSHGEDGITKMILSEP